MHGIFVDVATHPPVMLSFHAQLTQHSPHSISIVECTSSFCLIRSKAVAVDPFAIEIKSIDNQM